LALLTLAALLAQSVCAKSNDPVHRWSLGPERDPAGSLVATDDRVPFAPVKGHRNEAPGPHGERLAVRTNRGYFPRVFLEQADSSSHAIAPEGWSYLPGWSPDGQVMSCVQEDSASHVQALVLVDRSGARIRRFTQVATVIDYRWGPTAKSLVFYGIDRGTRKITLYWLDVLRGAATPVDTLDLIADYDFSWSAHGDLLAYARPTSTSEMEDITASDLWLAERGGLRKTRLTFTQDRVELEPRFVANRTLILTVAPTRGEEVGARREVQVDVVDATGTHGSHGK